MANPLSTVCQLVVEDKVDKYIKEETFEQSIVTPSHIVLTSERSGYNAVYVYSLTGQLQRTVTAVERGAVVSTLYGYDEATGDV